MHWMYLALAVAAEVTGSAALKQSQGFTKPFSVALSLVSFVVALLFLALALRVLPLGIAYAVWAGAGVVGVSVVGIVVFRQALDAPAMIGIGLILSGVVVISLLSRSVAP